VRFIDGKHIDLQFQALKFTEKAIIELKDGIIANYPKYMRHEIVIVNMIKLEK
jgi:hypothetical protein